MLTFHKCSYKYSYMTLAGRSIGFHHTQPYKRKKQQQMSGQRQRAEQSESCTCISIVVFAAREQRSPSAAQFLHAVWGLRLLLFSGALMRSCTGRSAAPCPAVSATVSCGVWAEADGPGVQGAPALRCSPASSPALRRMSRRRGEHTVKRDGFLLPHRLSCSQAHTLPVCWIRPTQVWCPTVSSLGYCIISWMIKSKCIYIKAATSDL